ncbi:hypothetical protein [Prosthecobacter sp.]|uniref:hypothetical protein n=1 Tax=Prosthecobacter sp. TaxID=1965333 RepID=UPI003783CDE3
MNPLRIRPAVLAWLLIAAPAFGGESMLTVTYQPLDGMGSGSIVIAEVTCHDWYATSGMATQIGLISARNVPPTNNLEQARNDVNLASLCGLRFEASDIGNRTAPLGLKLDATKFSVPKSASGTPEEIIRASLECLRRCLPAKLRTTPVTLSCRDSDKEWLQKIVSEFNAHDRTKVFFIPHT